MTKYCPICESEYQNSISVCPDDGGKLSAHPVRKKLEASATDIYAAAGEIEAECIVAFLQDIGIVADKYQTNLPQLPSPGDTRHIIAVPVQSQAKAIDAIKHARKDGVISDEGSFL